MNRRLSTLTVILILLCPGLVSQAAPPPTDMTTAYPLKKIAPKGYKTYQGIWGWVPASANKAVAFARNRVGDDRDLMSFTLTKTGVASSSRAVSTGMGAPRGVAALWIDDQAAASSATAAPYGLVFALFEREQGSHAQTGSIQVARFDASGARTSEWKEILSVPTAEGWYFSSESLFAARRDESIAVVPSFVMSGGNPRSYECRVYFLETNLQDGGLIGSPVKLPLPTAGKNNDGVGFPPRWNGQSWLVPVATSLCKPSTGEDKYLENLALVFVVAGDAGHKAVSKTIAKDKINSPLTFDGLFLTPYPESSKDSLLFVRHRTPVPEGERELDMFTYDFSIKQLGATGKTLKSLPVDIPAPSHRLTYDPRSTFDWEWDFWSECILRGDVVHVSRAHTIGLYSRYRGKQQYEQAVGFYAINALTGEAELKAQTINLWNEIILFQPMAAPFPGSSITVINGAYHSEDPYPWDNYFSTFVP